MQKQEAWARFWRGGSLTSFGDRFSKGYQGELRDLWTQFFESLPSGAVIVDFGAGNGALEEIAQSHATKIGKTLAVHAIDLAPRLPARFAAPDPENRCHIAWHPGTANEATGLETRSVDAIIGNYAFEYGNDERSIDEIARILKPAGAAFFLMHHDTSSLITGARVEIAVLDALLEKGNFLDAVREYLREFADIRKPDQLEKLKRTGKAEPLRLRMNETCRQVIKLATTQNAEQLVRQVMQWTGQLVSPPMFFETRQTLMARLKAVREELEANRARLSDMQAAAVGAERIAAIQERFLSHGFSVIAEPFHVATEDAPVGWKLHARRL